MSIWINVAFDQTFIVEASSVDLCKKSTNFPLENSQNIDPFVKMDLDFGWFWKGMTSVL